MKILHIYNSWANISLMKIYIAIHNKDFHHNVFCERNFFFVNFPKHIPNVYDYLFFISKTDMDVSLTTKSTKIQNEKKKMWKLYRISIKHNEFVYIDLYSQFCRKYIKLTFISVYQVFTGSFYTMSLGVFFFNNKSLVFSLQQKLVDSLHTK